MQVNLKQRELAAKNAAQILLENVIFKSSQHVACYLAQEDEFDCSSIINIVLSAKKNCYLPVLSKNNQKKLEFLSYQSGDALHLNRYHILEPVTTDHFPAEKLDIVILPLVGFDDAGSRLGRGAGYYDATFSFLLEQGRGKPYLLGLGYEQQRAAQLPNDPWDIKLDGVLTEKRLINLSDV